MNRLKTKYISNEKYQLPISFGTALVFTNNYQDKEGSKFPPPATQFLTINMLLE